MLNLSPGPGKGVSRDTQDVSPTQLTTHPQQTLRCSKLVCKICEKKNCTESRCAQRPAAFPQIFFTPIFNDFVYSSTKSLEHLSRRKKFREFCRRVDKVVKNRWEKYRWKKWPVSVRTEIALRPLVVGYDPVRVAGASSHFPRDRALVGCGCHFYQQEQEFAPNFPV